MDSSSLAVVADDDEDARTLVASLLRQLGLQVVEVCDGSELITRVHELIRGDEEVTLVISDIGMPECDGIAATHALLESYPSLTVVLMTAFGDQATFKLAMTSGAQHVLRKPFSLGALEALIERLRAPGR